jgi:hypothetical protein
MRDLSLEAGLAVEHACEKGANHLAPPMLDSANWV